MRLKILVAAGCFLSASLCAHADTYTTFDLIAALQSGSALGTVVLDDSTSQFTSANVTVMQGGVTYNIDSPSTTFHQTAGTISFFIGDTPGDNDGIAFDVGLPVSTLPGYLGSSICPTSCNGVQSGFTTNYGSTYDNATSGALTLDTTAVTPEPSSIFLFGTGLIGVARMVRKRSRLPFTHNSHLPSA